MKKSFWYLIILSLVSFWFFGWNITRLPISDGDTFYYIHIAKNILATGNWLDLKTPSQIVPKPPLVPWLMAASFKIFGANIFGVNFWHLVLAVGVVILTYLIGREMFNDRTGFLAGLIMATSALFFYQARSPLLDIPLLFFINLSFLFFWLFYKYDKIFYFYFFEISMGLALFVKALIGPFLILLVVLPFIFITRPGFLKKQNFKKHLVISSIIILVVFLSWFIRQYFLIGQDFLKMLFRENVIRFFHPIDGPTRATQWDFYSYFLYLVIGLVPWTGFAFAAVFYFWKNRSQSEKDFFLVLWFFLIFIFFSLSGHYKIPRYILPVFPALSIMTAVLFDHGQAENLKKYFLAGGIITWALVIPGAIAGYFWLKFQFPAEFGDYRAMFINVIYLLLGSLFLAGFSVFSKRASLIFCCFFLVALISYTYLIHSAVGPYNKIVPYLSLANSLKKEMPADFAVYQLKEGGQDLSFYLNQDLKELKTFKELQKFLASPGKHFVFTSGPDGVRSLPPKN